MLTHLKRELMLALNPNQQTCIGKEEDASPQPKQTKLLNASRPDSKREQTPVLDCTFVHRFLLAGQYIVTKLRNTYDGGPPLAFFVYLL